MKTFSVLALALILETYSVGAQENLNELESNKIQPVSYHNHLGFSAGNVSGVGLSYQRDLSQNLSAMVLVGGVAQKNHGDFNTGMTLKYAFSRITNRVRVLFVAGGSYFFDRDIDGIYDWDTQTYSDRERRYVKVGGGLGLEALFFDGKLGVDVNFIAVGASFQKKQDAAKNTFGNKPIIGPQVSLNYNF